MKSRASQTAQACRRTREKRIRTFAAQIKSAGHHGQHSGGMQPVRGEIGGVGSQNADGDFDRAVIDAAFDPVHDPAGDQADGQAGEDQVHRRDAGSENVGVS